MKQTEPNGFKRNEDGTFANGTAPGPGRPEETEEQKIQKKALKAIIEEYKESLADVLPELSPILKEMAKAKDIQAIKEVHDRVLGKAQQNVDLTSGGEKFSFNVVSYKDGNNDTI